MEFPEDLSYTAEHEWIRIEGDIATIGITNFAQDQLGDIVYVELCEVGDSFTAGEEFGSVEAVKTVSDLYMPVTGTVTEINEALEDAPELVNASPYEDGWMLKVQMSDPSNRDGLLSAEEYKTHTVQ